jgi:hypothetical protein
VYEGVCFFFQNCIVPPFHMHEKSAPQTATGRPSQRLLHMKTAPKLCATHIVVRRYVLRMAKGNRRSSLSWRFRARASGTWQCAKGATPTGRGHAYLDGNTHVARSGARAESVDLCCGWPREPGFGALPPSRPAPAPASRARRGGGQRRRVRGASREALSRVLAGVY